MALASRNPLYNDNRLKLGIFGINGKGGAQTLVPEAYRPSWPAAVKVAQMADRAGFEAIVGYARWKAYMAAKPDHPSGVVFDSFTFAAGLAQVTSYSTLFATSHAPTVHPITCAKQCVTVDHMSSGRFALNVVGGWNKHELDMFGAPLREHDQRYDQLQEWLTVMKRLWSEAEEFDFEGDFYKVVRASSRPQPFQTPHPPIMNAGGSPRGMRFACEHADICFVILQDEDPEACARQIAEYKNTARNEFGREVQVWTYCPVVLRDTQAEADAYLHHYAVEMEDKESVDAWSAGLAAQTKIVAPEKLQAFRKRFAAGVGGNILVGDADRVADQMHALADAGLDGVLCTFVDFVDGLTRFERDLMPLLEARGLRHPFETPAAAVGAGR